MNTTLKSFMLQSIENETKKKDPDWTTIETLQFAAAREELRLAMSDLEQMNLFAMANIQSALSLLEDVKEQRHRAATRRKNPL